MNLVHCLFQSHQNKEISVMIFEDFYFFLSLLGHNLDKTKLLITYLSEFDLK